MLFRSFHSACVRILRRHIDRLGYDSKFTIYDSDDQKTLMKDICKRLQIDTKQWKEKTLLGIISSAKNELIGAQEYEMNTMGDFSKRKIAEAYKEYQRQLRTNNALDFDDLIMKTVELFKLNPDVLEAYQERFKYIMVDEYQDTNTAQFKLISLLASKYQNLCVVGDDDQSIYKFRGANIRNILNFEDVFPSARVVKLEQNYRSTKTILDAANHVIRNNLERKNKTLWTANDGGAPIIFQNFMTAYEEAEYIAEDLAKRVAAGDGNYSDCAILYRTNAQSRLLEEKFLLANIPYRIIGGVNFYARKEIKDLLSYLKTVDNARDDLAVRRIINVPRRGIGAATLAKVQDFAVENEISFYNALRAAEEIPALGRSVAKLKPFVTLIQTLRAQQEYFSVAELLKEVIDRTDYVKELEDENTEESRARIENIDELISKAASYDEEAENPTLSGFLEEVALVADIDNLEENNDRVVLMTLHSAKGLEFPNVYLAGMEDGIFPSYMTIVSEDPTDLEEERRLCYVGITRAMRQLTITSARSRMIRGETQYNKVSRFIQEIPRELVQVGSMIKPKVQELPKQTAYIQAKQAFQAKAFEPKQYKVTKADKLEYGVGDRVKHIKFGAGTVENIVEGGKDYEVTVNFDRAGVKKMFAAFAKLKRE